MEVKLVKGGILRTEVSCGESAGRINFTFDLSEKAPEYLSAICTIDNDVTLSDVWLLLSRNMEALHEVLCNQLPAVVETAKHLYIGDWQASSEHWHRLYGVQDKIVGSCFADSLDMMDDLPVRLPRRLIISKAVDGTYSVDENSQHTLGEVLIGIVFEILLYRHRERCPLPQIRGPSEG